MSRAGIIHENIETPVLAFDEMLHAIDRGSVRHIKEQIVSVDAFRAQGHYGSMTASLAPCSEENEHSLLSQPARDLQTQALVRAGDERNFLRGYHRSVHGRDAGMASSNKCERVQPPAGAKCGICVRVIGDGAA